MSSTICNVSGGRTDSTAVAARYRTRIYRYVLRVVGDADRANDLTQETFLRVHQRLGELKDPAALEAWLFRIATNICYDRFRRREHRRPLLPLAEIDEASSEVVDDMVLRPDQLLEQRDVRHCVMRFLMKLPPAQREILLLHDLEGLTNPEIAVRLGLSLQNVKIRVHRARARLRVVLSEGCDFTWNDRGVFVCEPKPAPRHTTPGTRIGPAAHPGTVYPSSGASRPTICMEDASSRHSTRCEGRRAMTAVAATFRLDVEETSAVCPTGDRYAAQQMREGRIPVLSCEGPCIRGEIARQAAHRVAKQAPFARACQGELLAVPHSGMARWVRDAEHVVVIDGCYLRCQARMMRRMLRPDQLIEIDALVLYKQYTDVFEIDDVPEAERAAVAGKVAERVLSTLQPAVGGQPGRESRS